MIGRNVRRRERGRRRGPDRMVPRGAYDRTGKNAIARLNQLKKEADFALDNLSKPLRPHKPKKSRLLVRAVAVVLAIFGTLTIIASDGSHTTMIERDASMISAWTAQAQAEISQYAAREGSDFELLVHADAQSRGGEDDDEVRLDDLDQDLGTEDGEGEEVGEGGLEEEEAGGEDTVVSMSKGKDVNLGDVLKGVKDDGSCGRVNCRPHGYCKSGKCFCVAAFEGQDCKSPKPLPSGLKTMFEGNFVLNQKHVIEKEGIQIKTNPKAGSFRKGQTHTLFAPLVDKDRSKYNQKFTHGKTKQIENLRKSVITPSLLSAMPKLDFLNATVFERCAIVGNSGLSNLYKGGEEIDAHDVVIRFNSAPTVIKPRRRRRNSRNPRVQPDAEPVSFVEHVGRKKTFRFINTQHIRFFEGKEIRLQQMQSKNGLFRYLIYRKRYPHSRLYAFDTDFTSYVSSNIPVLPTGGYFAVLFAIQLCREVNMYGFHWQAGHAIPHHYFNNEVPVEGKEKIHDYDAEHVNLLHIARAGILNISQPCVPGCEAKSKIPCKSCLHGSACGCGQNMPTPLSIPGFCHLKHNYTCYFKCPRPSQCPGGPSNSRCPNSLLNHFSDKQCATVEDVPEKYRHPGSLASHPKWMQSE